MEREIVCANPAGNITVFVLSPPAGKKDGVKDDKALIAKALMADPGLKAEQIGFAYRPRKPGDLWRLEMAGGEFCGNAGRSFGLLAALQDGLRGRHTVMIQTSGINEPVPVHIDTEAGTAEIVIPGPIRQTEITFSGMRFPVYEFEGITHVIAENTPPGEELVRDLILKANEDSRQSDCGPRALGVMFYDSAKDFMRPAVWLRETGTVVFESSCGSGSAALGVWAVRNAENADTEIDPAQPGGAITVRVAKRDGKITRLSIAGKVTFGEILRYAVSGETP